MNIISKDSLLTALTNGESADNIATSFIDTLNEVLIELKEEEEKKKELERQAAKEKARAEQIDTILAQLINDWNTFAELYNPALTIFSPQDVAENLIEFIKPVEPMLLELFKVAHEISEASNHQLSYLQIYLIFISSLLGDSNQESKKKV